MSIRVDVKQINTMEKFINVNGVRFFDTKNSLVHLGNFNPELQVKKVLISDMDECPESFVKLDNFSSSTDKLFFLVNNNPDYVVATSEEIKGFFVFQDDDDSKREHQLLKKNKLDLDECEFYDPSFNESVTFIYNPKNLNDPALFYIYYEGWGYEFVCLLFLGKKDEKFKMPFKKETIEFFTK